MTPEETKICGFYVYAVEHFDELADRELSVTEMEKLLSLTNYVTGIARRHDSALAAALRRSTAATKSLHSHWDDPAVHPEWISARNELLAIWKRGNALN
jgi:hypothetical protein